MKKLLVFSLVFSLLLSVLGAYTVPTSKGDIELIVPDGYTLEEAYVEMARLYLEERWDHEDLIDKADDLTREIDIYIDENRALRESYSKLLKDYEKLNSLLEAKSKVVPVQGFLGINASFSERFSVLTPSLKAGVFLFEKVMLETSLGYPWSLGIGAGFVF